MCGQVRSDWFVYVVLSCLPWVGKELYEKKDVEMDRLLSQVEGYLKYDALSLSFPLRLHFNFFSLSSSDVLFPVRDSVCVLMMCIS